MKKLIAVTVITIMLFTMSAGAIDLVATEDYHIDDEKEFSVTMYTPVQDAKKTRYESVTSVVMCLLAATGDMLRIRCAILLKAIIRWEERSQLLISLNPERITLL